MLVALGLFQRERA